MPIAGGKTVGEVKKVLLRSCPPDGFVVLRRLTYGEKMQRRALLGKATVVSGDSKRRGGRDFTAEMNMINEQVTLMEFSKSIVDHNLSILTRPGDEGSETPVDFSNPVHVKLLDGVVGEEIDDAIMNFNDLDGDEEMGKSPN